MWTRIGLEIEMTKVRRRQDTFLRFQEVQYSFPFLLSKEAEFVAMNSTLSEPCLTKNILKVFETVEDGF